MNGSNMGFMHEIAQKVAENGESWEYVQRTLNCAKM
jgi:hypothetical protein